MLYVFHGTDVSQAAAKARALVETLRAKKPDAAFVRLEGDGWDASVLQSHLGGQGLFSQKYIVLLDRVTENVNAKEQLADYAAAMKESSNIFIVAEGKLLVDLRKALEKNADKVVEVGENHGVGSTEKGAGSGKREEFNIFALADAVGSRDPLRAWTIYRQAIDRGIEPENVIGTLFWQLKSMAVAATGQSAGETGLSPFVYSKAKKAAGNYSAAELRDLTKKIVTLYHDGHRGLVDMELGVEMVMLGLR